jgi:hypothetical protein
MATYKFEQFKVEIIDPTVTIHGKVGTEVHNGVEQSVTYADVLLTTKTAKFAVQLLSDVTPKNWDIESLEAWVAAELEKFKISE